MSSQLLTGWLCIATSGTTIDGRYISPMQLDTIAKRYDPDFYTALIWPNGDRTMPPMGSVVALMTRQEGEKVRLFAKLEPTLKLIDANLAGRYRFCAIETIDNFAGTGHPYLFGLHATDEPSMTELSAIKFHVVQHPLDDALELDGRIPTFSARSPRFVRTSSAVKESPMNLQAILDSFIFSATPGATLSTNTIYLEDNALMSCIWQASPLLARMTFRIHSDPYQPAHDPLKPTLRTGRKTGERFIVRADPSQQIHVFNEHDSSVIFTWQELATLLGGLDQAAAHAMLESLALAMFADDVVRIGFYGHFAAPDTDPATYPNGEDVAPGWHALAKAQDPDGKRILRTPVTFDPKGGAEYASLDAMVYRLLEVMPAPWRTDPRLQVLVGSELLQRHKQAHLAPGLVRSKEQQLKIADLPVNTHQHMPGNFLAITFLSNLQVIGLERCERLATGDLNDDHSWGIRFCRPQAYALGAVDAYTAFDAIHLPAIAKE